MLREGGSKVTRNIDLEGSERPERSTSLPSSEFPSHQVKQTIHFILSSPLFKEWYECSQP